MTGRRGDTMRQEENDVTAGLILEKDEGIEFMAQGMGQGSKGGRSTFSTAIGVKEECVGTDVRRLEH